MAPKPKPEDLAFTCLTFEVDPDVHKAVRTIRKIRESFEVVKQQDIDGNKVTISGEIDGDKVMKRIERISRFRSVKNMKWSTGECSTNLKKKEAAPKTNNNNNNNQDMGPIYPCYYNNGYGGYDTGYGYNYGFPYPTFGGNNYATYKDNTLECGGHAADCASHHKEKRDHSTENPGDKSSSSKKPEKNASVSFKKLGVYGHKERGCCIM